MRNAILLGLTLLWPLASWAADDYRPLDVKLGLWESTVTSLTSGMPPIPDEVLSRLSPDQRARMEAAQKARESKGPQTRTTKSCLTKDQLNKPLALGGEDNGSCKRTLITSSSTKQEVHIECSDPKSTIKGTGNVHLEAVNSENIKGTTQVSSGGGRGMNIQMSFSAKWVSADCGDVGKK